jgi:hypothetical protein
MNRNRWIVFVCICLGMAALGLAGNANAAPAPAAPPAASISTPDVHPTASISTPLPVDEFVLAGEVTSSVSVCQSCGIIDACLGKHKHAPCKPSDPACTCESCNGNFECYK